MPPKTQNTIGHPEKPGYIFKLSTKCLAFGVHSGVSAQVRTPVRAYVLARRRKAV